MAEVEAGPGAAADGMTSPAADALALPPADAMTSPAADAAEETGARPTERLPVAQLLQITLYWLGIAALQGGLGIAVQKRLPAMVPPGETGIYIAIQGLVILWVNILVQPTVGMLSDYTVSRWGRRKPYIAIGATLDVLFVIGFAFSNSYVSLVAFLALLQFSSNFAQGPFQGYVPDLVPEEQVGLASALLGAMQTVGFVIGGAVVTLTLLFGGDQPDYTIPTILVGLIEFATAMGTIRWVREGGRPRDRRGRSWLQIARSAWAVDILRERSFVALVLSRLMFFAGVNAFLGFWVIFLDRTMTLTNAEQGTLYPVTQLVIALLTAVATIPAARISDRVGRKPVIYVASGIGAAGLAVMALSPSFWVFLVGAAIVACASGTFLAVDWALMTDIIPKAASGRYMGISNIAVAAAGALAAAVVGPVMDAVGGPQQSADGPRAAYLAAVVFFILAAWFLRRVDPRPRTSLGPQPVPYPAQS
ncbi:MAG TPA: MFS transporter [Candidatus Limnocylindrales bacterium]|nr:MFS transporter [Candidatus Limnocylindrales bacterium]